MQKLRVCMIIAKAHPETLQLDAAAGAASATAEDDMDVAGDGSSEVAASASKPDKNSVVCKGLDTFLLHPEGVKGKKLLDHMLLFAKRRVPRGDVHQQRLRCKCATHLRPSEYLDLSMSADQLMMMDPSPEDLTIREILKDAGGDGATKKLAKRKLDSVGFINAHCCHANSESRTAELKQSVELAASMAAVKHAEHNEKKKKQETATATVSEMAPAALRKLHAKNMAFTELTVKELQSISVVCFKKDPPQGKKPAVIEAVLKWHAKHAGTIDAAILALPAAPLARAAPQKRGRDETALDESESEESEEEESQDGEEEEADGEDKSFTFEDGTVLEDGCSVEAEYAWQDPTPGFDFEFGQWFPATWRGYNRDLKQHAVAVTDLGGVYGANEWYINNVRPVS